MLGARVNVTGPVTATILTQDENSAACPVVVCLRRLETLPNRNSLQYMELYGIPEAQTVFRGTLRYEGWSQVMYGCKALGLFETTPTASSGGLWREELGKGLGLGAGVGPEGLEAAMVARLTAWEVAQPHKVVSALEWLGVLGSEASVKGATVLEAFCTLLEERLRFNPGERDMVLMRHDITVEGEGQVEQHTSSLLVFGDARDSAMAKTVGTTCGMATELVLEGEVREKPEFKGVLTPLSAAVYNPLLERLAQEGMSFDETVVRRPVRKG